MTSSRVAGGSEISSAVEIIKDKFYFATVRNPDNLQAVSAATKSVCFCIDNELLYEPFFADFGPLNLGLCYRFCTKLDGLLKEYDAKPENHRQKIVFCCANDPYRKANAATLVGVYCTLYLDMNADDAYKPLTALKPFAPFRDASCGASTFHLTVLDCIRGMEKAKSVGFVDFHLREKTTFNLEEYEYYEQVENGDLNWIQPGKFIAFSGPSNKRTEYYGYRTLVPEDYWDFFRKSGVSAIVRLNKKMYDKNRFTEGGFRHHELYFPDGSCPSDAILMRFIEMAEAEPGVICIHCKAGLGRTGVLICCYIMKHFRFTANEVIGYIRICRPGSVIGPQQHYLKEMEQRCWRMGDQARAQANVRNEMRLGEPGAHKNVDYGEQDENADRRNSSPVKPMRSGTRPQVVTTTTSYSQNRQSGMYSYNSTGQLGVYRGVGSGANAVAAANGTMGTGGRVRYGGLSSSGFGSVTSSVPNLRRSTTSNQGSGFISRGNDMGMSKPMFESSNSGMMTQGRALNSSSQNRNQYGSPVRTSQGVSTSQPHPPPAHMAPGSAPSTLSGGVTRSQQGSPFTGRIVTANGQPRKGAAAMAALHAASQNQNQNMRSYGGVTGGSPYSMRAGSSPLRARNV